MVKETLSIKNLGPLRNACLDDIRPVMVLVGATGSGKSLIVKVLAMMRHVCKKQIVRRALKLSGVKRSLMRVRRDTYLQYADIGHLVGLDTQIEYTLSCDGLLCRVHLDKDKFKTDFLEEDGITAVGPFLKVAFICDSRNLLASWARKGAVVQSKVFDNYFADTYALWDEAMSAKESLSPAMAFIGAKLKIGGSEGGRRKLVIEDASGRKTLFERGASGQKASIPVAIILRYLLGDFDFRADIQHDYLKVILDDMVDRAQGDLSLLRHRKFEPFASQYLCVHIEEPELSLDPATQMAFADDLMGTFNAHFRLTHKPEVETSVIFTTHSPYWVTSLNTIVEEGRNDYLTWERIGGYLVTDSGELRPLRDEEAHLLLTPNMDAATQILDERYNAALDAKEVVRV